jgi:hypothetical protein
MDLNDKTWIVGLKLKLLNITCMIEEDNCYRNEDALLDLKKVIKTLDDCEPPIIL